MSSRSVASPLPALVALLLVLGGVNGAPQGKLKSCVNIPECQSQCDAAFQSEIASANTVHAEVGQAAETIRDYCYRGCAYRSGDNREGCNMGCTDREEVLGTMNACKKGCQLRCRLDLDEAPLQDPAPARTPDCKRTLRTDCDNDKYDRKYAEIISQTSGYKQRIIDMRRRFAEQKQAEADKRMAAGWRAGQPDSVIAAYSPAAMAKFTSEKTSPSP